MNISEEAQRIAVPAPPSKAPGRPFLEDPDTRELYLRVLTVVLQKPSTADELAAELGVPDYKMQFCLRRWAKQKRIDRTPDTSSTPEGGRPCLVYHPPSRRPHGRLAARNPR